MKICFVLCVLGSAYGQELSTFACAPTTIGVGSATSCTVTLTTPAPLAGFPVRIVRNGTGIVAPTTVTVGWTSAKSTFQVTTATATPPQTATLAAVAGTITKTVTLTVVSAASVAYTINSIACSPPALVPGQQTTCTGAMTPPAPLAGMTGKLVSSSSNLPVPATLTVPGNASGFTFSTTAAPGTASIEHDTVTATVAGSQKSVPITIDPNPKFLFRALPTEMRSFTDGAAVVPAILPANWTGTLSVRGGGYAHLDSGVAFAVGGNQNNDSAYVNFSSPSFGPVFSNSSEISFKLKSAYTFEERRGLGSGADGMRGVFEIFDATGSWAMFSTYTTDAGQLQFAFAALGYAGTYAIPAGTEDAVFGKGVTARIKITWTAKTFSLWLNDRLVRTNTISAQKVFYWDATSAFTIGARSVRLQGGGYYACDDTISDFVMR